MPIKDLQMRARELGRIRMGAQVTGTSKAGKEFTRPAKLEKFRLTAHSRPLLEKAADLYGGEVKPWTPKGGNPQYEVYTDATRIPIWVPPSENAITQWYETWSGGGCTHRCSGVGEEELITGKPCDGGPLHQQSKPTTRVSIILPEVEGLGVWRLESHGWNAAMELPEAAKVLQVTNGYVQAHLALEHRTQKTLVDGKPETRKFLVPVIEIAVTPAALMAGEGIIRPPAIEGPVPRALVSPVDALPAGAPSDEEDQYVDMFADATTPDEVNAIWEQAHEAGHLTETVKASGRAAAERIKNAGPPTQQAESLEVPTDGTTPVGPDDEGVWPAEVVPDDGDVDDLYNQAVALAGELGWNLWKLEEEYKAGMSGQLLSDANAEQLTNYINHLKTSRKRANQ